MAVVVGDRNRVEREEGLKDHRRYLASLPKQEEAEAFVEQLDQMIAQQLTNDYWKISLPGELATSGGRSPTLLGYIASLCVLDAPVLFSKMRCAELLDPALMGGSPKVQRHHPFPRKHLEKLGIVDLRQVNQIANLTPLEWHDNLAISAEDPSVYWPAYLEAMRKRRSGSSIRSSERPSTRRSRLTSGAPGTRAARLLAENQAEPERVAAHLLVAPPAADAEVVAVLREAARRASSRGAPESASACLRRALTEPPAASERADLLLELGAVEALVSGEDAVEHLREAYDLLDEPTPRAEAALLLGDQLARLSPHESVGVFRHELEQLGGAEAELERLLEAGLIRIALSDPQLYNEATRRLERVRRGSSGDATIGEKMLLAELAFDDARAGAPAAVAVPLARRALAGGALRCEVSAEPFVLACIVLVMAHLDEPLRLYDAALAEAHQRGSILDFAIAKVYRAHAFVCRGDLAEAEAEGREALDACEAWGTSARFETVLAAFVSEALMEQGKLEDAADALARADLEHAPPDKVRLFLNSRARFRMLEGDPAGGLEDALEAGRRFEAVGGRNPAFTAWRSQAALALLQLGEREEAGRLAGEELELARSWGAPRALGAALRRPGAGRRRRRGDRAA